LINQFEWVSQPALQLAEEELQTTVSCASASLLISKEFEGIIAGSVVAASGEPFLNNQDS